MRSICMASCDVYMTDIIRARPNCVSRSDTAGRERIPHSRKGNYARARHMERPPKPVNLMGCSASGSSRRHQIGLDIRANASL